MLISRRFTLRLRHCVLWVHLLLLDGAHSENLCIPAITFNQTCCTSSNFTRLQTAVGSDVICRSVIYLFTFEHCGCA